MEIMRQQNSECWLVGGTVRDWYLGYSPLDLDVTVNDDPASFAKILAKKLQVPFFPLSTRHGAYRVVVSDCPVDVAHMQGATIIDDLACRDFTINAMAMPVTAATVDNLLRRLESTSETKALASSPKKSGEMASALFDNLLDPFEGRRHLAEQRLVAVSDHIFIDDPLRIMRAIRFSHVLGFTLDENLETMLRSQKEEIARAASERVMSELSLSLEAGNSASLFQKLEEFGLFSTVLPEIVNCNKEIPADTVVVLAALDSLLACLTVDSELTSSDAKVADGFAAQNSEVLDPRTLNPSAPLWISLLRARLQESVDGTFPRHAALRLAALLRVASPQVVGAVGRRLRLSGDLISLMQAVCRIRQNWYDGNTITESRQSLTTSVVTGNSLFPACPEVTRNNLPPVSDALLEVANNNLSLVVSSARSTVEFLWDAAPWEPEVLLITAAEIMASTYTGQAQIGRPANAATFGASTPIEASATSSAMPELPGPVISLLERWAARQVSPLELPFDGRFIMQALDLKPGPLLGQILKETRLAWEAGEVNTAVEALQVAKVCAERNTYQP